MAMMKCPVCGVSVKAENLERHLRNQHPHEQVDLSETLSEEDRQAIKEQKSAGRSGLTRGGRRLLMIVGIVIAVVIVAAIGVQFLTRPAVTPGSAAPNFTLAATDGATITLSAWRGSPVLIEFMDVDCPYCQQEAPSLSVLYQNYSARGVRFVSIDINFDGADDTPSRITTFKTTYNTPWPYCLDSLAGVASHYGVSSTPTSFIINKDGTVNVKLVGLQPMGNFVSALDSALGG
jgi:peroxiredoxin